MWSSSKEWISPSNKDRSPVDGRLLLAQLQFHFFQQNIAHIESPYNANKPEAYDLVPRNLSEWAEHQLAMEKSKLRVADRAVNWRATEGILQKQAIRFHEENYVSLPRGLLGGRISKFRGRGAVLAEHTVWCPDGELLHDLDAEIASLKAKFEAENKIPEVRYLVDLRRARPLYMSSSHENCQDQKRTRDFRSLRCIRQRRGAYVWPCGAELLLEGAGREYAEQVGSGVNKHPVTVPLRRLFPAPREFRPEMHWNVRPYCERTYFDQGFERRIPRWETREEALRPAEEVDDTIGMKFLGKALWQQLETAGEC